MADRYCRACGGKNGEHFPPCTTIEPTPAAGRAAAIASAWRVVDRMHANGHRGAALRLGRILEKIYGKRNP